MVFFVIFFGGGDYLGVPFWIVFFQHLAMGQNLRYLFSRDYHLLERFFKGHRGYGVFTHSHLVFCSFCGCGRVDVFFSK